jgi:uncharacterized BrkB/YihY/UPF0761 family membrane protein
MIVSWLFRSLPGPAWLRAVVLIAVAALLGFLLWEWGFRWLAEHLGSLLEGNPTVGLGQ